MAGNTINIRLNVEDPAGTLKVRIGETKTLNNELERTNKLTSGAKQALYRSAPGETKTSRSIGPGAGTGSATSDFAAQAQGLGGLVHVYATFAANLFAVGAAFTALKSAADTTNMIDGLNQLGAVSGRSLGALSKSIVSVTEGAVSLKDAMTATAQATAAGMSSTNLLKLAEGAKNASAVLGISMPDALSRLSRGVTKLEPELLDELGIFVKVDKANQDYARSIGKSTSSLTDFEKRSAFAAAVLTELDNKFGSLEARANPFSKLSASLETLLQKGLAVINTVVGPLVEALASSPTALAAAITAVGISILKMAMPAISNWRAVLLKQAEVAKEAASHANETYAAYQHEMTLKHESEINARLATEKQAVSKSLAIMQSAASGGVKSGKLFNLIQGGVDTPEKQEQAKKLIDSQIKRLNTLSEKTATTDIAESLAYKAKADALAKTRVELDSYIKSIEVATARKAELYAAEEKEDIGNIVRRRNLEKLATRYRQADILSNVSRDTEELGFFGAISKLKDRIAGKADDGMGPPQKSLEGWAKWSTTVKGYIGASVTAISNFMSAFSEIGIAVSAVAAVFGILDSWASKANKELDSFNTSIDKTKEISEGLDRTVKSLFKNKGMTIEGVSALATAYSELAATLEDNATKLDEFKTKSGTWDDIKQKLKALFKQDATSDFAKTTAKEIAHVFDVASSSKEKDKFVESIKSTFGEISEGSDILVKVGSSEESAKALLDIYKEYAKELANSASRMMEFKAAIDQAAKTAKDLSNSFIPADNIGKLGMAMFTVADKLQASIKDPLESFKELNAVIKDTSTMALFSPEFAKQLAEQSSQISGLASTIDTIDAVIIQKKEELSKMGYGSSAGGQTERTDQGKYLESVIAKLEQRSKELKLDTSKYTNLVKETQIDAAKRGAELLSSSIQMAFEKAALTVEKAKSTFSGLGSAKAELDISNKEISIQQQQIKAQIENTEAMKDLTLTFEAQALEDKLKAATTPQEKASISKELTSVNVQKSLLRGNATYKTVQGIISSPEASDEAKAGALAMSSYLATRAGYQAQSRQLEANKEANKEAEREKSIREEITAKNQTNFAVQKQQLATEQSRLQVLSQLLSGITTSYDISIANNKLQQMEVDNSKAVYEYQKQLEILKGKKGAEKEIEVLNIVERERKANLDIQKSLEEQNILRLKIQDTYLKEKYIRDSLYQKRTIELSIATQEEAAQQDILNIKSELGIITAEQLRTQNLSIATSKVIRDTESETLKITKDRDDKLAEIQNKIDQINISESKKPMRNASEYVAPEELTLLEQQKNDIKSNAELQLTSLDNVKAKKLEAIELDKSMSFRQKEYSKIFLGAFEKMGDALADFAKTGKLDFAGLVDSMISDLIRFELKQQSMKLFSEMGGGTKDGVIGSLMNWLASANGNVFGTTGVQAFATGGAFTNSIVNSPTLFKFANGTGLMGEAGPEAIMPLKRDNNGNLGVRASSTNTGNNVVVNVIESKDKAGTQERTTDNGVDVVNIFVERVKSSIAGDISRGSGLVANALNRTYGLNRVAGAY